MKKKLTVGLTYDLASEHKLRADDPADRYSEFDTPKIIAGIARAIESSGFAVKKIGNFQALLSQISQVKKTVDIVFNTAEGLSGRNREAQVPLLLEYADIPYVGSDALTMSVTLDKVTTKKVLLADNIPTPKFIVTDTPVTQTDCQHVRFPLIVKPRWEGSSKGIVAKARVETVVELNKQITRVVSLYKQPVLIEEFISGREFTVAIIGNGKDARALPILEVHIRGKSVGDKVFLARYVYSADVQYVVPEDLDETLRQKIIKLALATYQSVECKDFGRVDVRVDTNNAVYVLEINPLPALSVQDAFGVLSDVMHTSYEHMVGQILHAALARIS